MSLKIYTSESNFRTLKIKVAAAIANVELQEVIVKFEDLEKPDFLAKNPLGKVPVLETPEGYLAESNAILQYIARNSPLVGVTDFQKAKVQQWLDFASGEIEPHQIPLVLPVLGYFPIDAQTAQREFQELSWRIKVLDEYLKGNNYLVGETLTIADINLATYFKQIFTFNFGEAERKNYPNVLRWFEHISQIPAFVNFFGRTRYAKIPFPALQFVQPPAQFTHMAKKEGKKETKKQEEKPPKVQQEEEEEPAPKKAENPFEKLPPSTFDIDSWKRQFLASKDLKAEFEWFWQNLDVNGWSIWEVIYQKTENEGKVLIVTKNNMNGFLQRTDPHFKRYAFAVHGVYGDQPDLHIRGAWLWRGTEVPQYFLDHPTFEYMKFVKLDASKAEDRARYEEYWLNQEEEVSKVQGQTVQTVSYFR